MNPRTIFVQALDNAWATVNQAAGGLSHEELSRRPTDQTNPVGWIVWHMSRVADAIVNGIVGGQQQVWVTGDWPGKFGLEPDPRSSGGGWTPEQVGAFKCPSPEDLLGYANAVARSGREQIERLTDEQIDEQVRFFDRHMTRGEVLTFTLGELHQHAGHISYLRGIFRGTDK